VIKANLNSTPIYAEMQRRLAEVRMKYYRERVLYGIVLTTMLGIAVVSLFSLMEEFVAGGIAFRTSLFILGSLGIVGIAVRFIVLPMFQWGKMLKGISEREFAQRVGEKFPSVKDRLRNILDIFDEQNREGEKTGSFRPEYSPELIDASFADLQKAAGSFQFTEVISNKDVRKAEKTLSVVLACAVVLFVVPQLNLPFAAYRLGHFRTDFQTPAAFIFRVQPGNAEVVKGEPVPVTIALLPNVRASSLRASLPNKISLLVRQEGNSAEESFELTPDSSGLFRFVLPALRQSIEYRAEANDIRSDGYTITVIDRPVVRFLKVHLIPPAYSRLPSQSLDDNVGDVTALSGTLVRWHIDVSKPLRKAALVFDDGKERVLSNKDGEFFGEEVLRGRSRYHIALEDSEGFTNVDPIEYKLDMTSDEAPTVAITFPGRNIDITGGSPVPLQLKIHDDFGFTNLQIGFRLIHSRYEKPKEQFSYVPIPLASDARSTNSADVNFQWDLSGMGLVPEDVVEYHAEVFDNDNVSGPQKGVSESYLLRLPSLNEVFADADKGEEENIEKLDKSLEEANDLKKDLEDISQAMKTSQPLDWQKQKKAEETLKRYEELTKKVDEVSKSLGAMTQDMEKNNVLSGETLKKYMELQQLLQQVNSPEFQEAMKKMQQAMQGVSPDQMRQAMQQVQFSEKAFRQSIERTMDLLKRIQVEQKMDEMVKRANDLQQQEEQLEKETSENSAADQKKGEELARKQDDINAQLAELQAQLAALRKKMEEFPGEMPMKQLEKAEQAAHDSSLEQSVEQSAQQLRSQRPQQALTSQQQAGKAMHEMAQRFSEMQEQLLSNQMNEALNGMRKAMSDILEISQQEEDLKDQAQTLSPNSQRFRENAEKQSNLLGDMGNVTKNLVDLSQKSFIVTPEMGHAVGTAMAKMNQAMTGLEQRNGQMAATQQDKAMASLNKAASIAQASMDAMQKGSPGGTGGSLLQQLRRMAGEQQSINIKTEELSQGQGLSEQQIQEMGRLGQQQEAVRKSLEQLNKEAQSGSERNRVMGDLQKIADDMKEVVANLEQNHVNPNTIKQQQRILSRLLDAQTSMRERDYEQRRTSTAGITPVRPSPAELQEASVQNQLRHDLLKAIEEGYAKDYQDLIRKYYDALDKMK